MNTIVVKKKMITLRKKGMSLKNIAEKFDCTKQYVCICIGRTNENLMKDFRYICKTCKTSFGYRAKKERSGTHKYCCTKCYGVSKNILHIPAKVGTKKYGRLKAALYYKLDPRKQLERSKKYYYSHIEQCRRKMRESYYKRKNRKRGDA